MSEELYKFAVVQFTSDGRCTAIPKTWLIQDESDEFIISKCWWPPREVNCVDCISNCTPPNSINWSQHEIEIIKYYCFSVDSARECAAANNRANEEKNLRREKRQKTKQSRPETKDLPEIPPHSPLKCDGENISNEEQPIIPVKVLEELPNIEVSGDQSETSFKEEISESLKQILSQLQDITQRLITLENKLNENATKGTQQNTDYEIILNLIPIESVAKLKEFEGTLEQSEEAVRQFRAFFSKIGGATPKLAIQRALNKLIQNKCAKDCSFKGKRNNFRMENLLIIKILREEIIKYRAITEAEFDGFVAEWLRFAKQRMEREQNKLI